MPMALEVHDFKRAARLKTNLKGRLCEWLEDFCAIFVDKLTPKLPFELNITLKSTDTSRSDVVLNYVPDGSVGYRLALGEHETETLISLPKGLARAFISGLLGDHAAKVDATSELTPAENTVFKFLIEVLAEAATDCRIYGEQVPTRVRRELSNLHRMAIFDPGDNVVAAEFEVTGPFGSESWQWLIPYHILADLFEPEKQPGERQSPEQAAYLKQLVDQMNTEVYSRLGTARLKATELRSLKVGDLLILDQRINHPLPTFVGGEQAYLVWPGRVGSRQAVQIMSRIKE